MGGFKVWTPLGAELLATSPPDVFSSGCGIIVYF